MGIEPLDLWQKQVDVLNTFYSLDCLVDISPWVSNVSDTWISG